jgi:uncharacterized protein YbjQ (UPF0145 family)
MFDSKATSQKSDPHATNAQAEEFFTSDLSTKEFSLLQDIDFEPLGLVVGSSIYHIGFQKPKFNQSQELETLTQAMYHARDLAITRMEAEASALGADGLVGVKLTIGMQQWGYRPLAFVMGNCVYHIGYQGIKAAFSQAFQNVEMPTYTQALYEAREMAISRMRSEGRENGGSGVLGVTVTQSCQAWDSHIIEFFAVGTSVVKTADTRLASPGTVLPMFDPPG